MYDNKESWLQYDEGLNKENQYVVRQFCKYVNMNPDFLYNDSYLLDKAELFFKHYASQYLLKRSRYHFFDTIFNTENYGDQVPNPTFLVIDNIFLKQLSLPRTRTEENLFHFNLYSMGGDYLELLHHTHKDYHWLLKTHKEIIIKLHNERIDENTFDIKVFCEDNMYHFGLSSDIPSWADLEELGANTDNIHELGYEEMVFKKKIENELKRIGVLVEYVKED